MVGAIVAGWLPGEWFGPLAVGSAIISLAGLLSFPMAFPVSSTLGAVVVNAAVLVAVLRYDWLPSDLTA